MKKTIGIIAAFIVLANLAVASDLASNRPDSWAQPIALDGVPNLNKVSDNLFRSAQPSIPGMKNLRQMGNDLKPNHA